jgi:hypothetical protein
MPRTIRTQYDTYQPTLLLLLLVWQVRRGDRVYVANTEGGEVLELAYPAMTRVRAAGWRSERARGC